MKEKRVNADLVVAGLLKIPRGEILLVEREGYLTIPTGHMDASQDVNLQETLIREMKEEIKFLKTIVIVETLDTFVRNEPAGRKFKPKSIAIYSCNVHEEEIAHFIEKSQGKRKEIIWIRPSQAAKLPYLDGLAKMAIGNFLQKYGREKGGNGNGDKKAIL